MSEAKIIGQETGVNVFMKCGSIKANATSIKKYIYKEW